MYNIIIYVFEYGIISNCMLVGVIYLLNVFILQFNALCVN